MLVYPTIKEAPIAGLSGFGGGASSLVSAYEAGGLAGQSGADVFFDIGTIDSGTLGDGGYALDKISETFRLESYNKSGDSITVGTPDNLTGLPTGIVNYAKHDGPACFWQFNTDGTISYNSKYNYNMGGDFVWAAFVYMLDDGNYGPGSLWPGDTFRFFRHHKATSWPANVLSFPPTGNGTVWFAYMDRYQNDTYGNFYSVYDFWDSNYTTRIDEDPYWTNTAPTSGHWSYMRWGRDGQVFKTETWKMTSQDTWSNSGTGAGTASEDMGESTAGPNGSDQTAFTRMLFEVSAYWANIAFYTTGSSDLWGTAPPKK